MWAHACDLLERAERLHREFASLGEDTLARGPVWEPPVDVVEVEDELTVLVALPGIAPEDIEIHIDSEGLTITGERRLSALGTNSLIHRLEIPQGRFERRLALDMRRLELRTQEVVHGCLRLGFRKFV